MKLSKDSRRITRALFRRSLVDGRVDEGRVSGIVKTIASDKPREYLRILKEYQRLLRMEMARHHAIVETAGPVAQADAEKITADIRRRHGAGLTTEFRLNPALIGGLRVRIASNVWDGTVLNRLNLLKAAF